jgi:DNA-binding transcriptional ArsR family regulator
MVYYNSEALSLAFGALADPTRRAIVDRLANAHQLAVSEIAAPFAVSLPAVIKHLDVLARADLIVRSKRGRTVYCRLRGEAMASAVKWLTRYERFWTERLDRLASFLQEDECSTSQASPSSDGSKRRPHKSSARGPTRKK